VTEIEWYNSQKSNDDICPPLCLLFLICCNESTPAKWKIGEDWYCSYPVHAICNSVGNQELDEDSARTQPAEKIARENSMAARKENMRGKRDPLCTLEVAGVQVLAPRHNGRYFI